MFARIQFRLTLLVILFALCRMLSALPLFATSPVAEGHIYLPTISNGSAAPTPTPSPTSTPTLPPTTNLSDQAMIANALAQGKIDYGESLLYRFYSLFADDRLPAEYRGTGSIGEDASLFAEATDPTLAAEVRAKLQPFLRRPDHPQSVHSVQALNRGQVSVQGSNADQSTLVCEGAWAAQSSAKPGVKVRVHALCFNDYTADIQFALNLIESLWTPMTNFMGAPIPDMGGTDGGSSPEIDFYLLDPLGIVWRDGANQGIRAGALAVAPSAQPFNNDRSSGYVLMARRDIRALGFKSTLAHEFFHVLQDAHNHSIAFNGPTEWWFVEASAKWAEWYFVPENSDSQVHGLFSATFRNADQPLHRSYDISSEEKLKVGYSAYAGYIWPFFVQQEKGKSSMNTIWKELETVGSNWDKAQKVLDEDYPFALHFHRFAFRNLNSDFGGINPLGKRYVDLDPKFPDNWLPVANIEQELTVMPPQSPLVLSDTIPSLRAHYYHFTVEGGAEQVKFDLTGLQPLLDRKVGAMVKIKDKPWQMRELVSDVLTFCLSNEEEDLEEIWFVVSNHNQELDKTVAGDIKVWASDLSCGCDIDTWAKFQSVTAWQGHVTYRYTQSGAKDGRTATITENGNLSSTLIRTPSQVFWGKVISGTTAIDYKETCCQDYVQTVTGSGMPVPFGKEGENDSGYSRMMLNFREFDCSYGFHTDTFVNGVSTSADESTPGIFHTGSVGRMFHPLPMDGLVLSGSGSFPSHTVEFILTYDDDFYGSSHDLELEALLGEDNLGDATITWEFRPVDPSQ